MIALSDSWRMTAEEYLEWEALQDLRYELIDGDVVAMTGGTIAHNRIALNLYTKLRPHAQKDGCQLTVADVKVKVEATGNYFYPDLVVSCDDRDREATKEIIFPGLLVEVLSPRTEAKDRGKKWQNYRQIPTLIEYVLINCDRRLVECFRRRDRLWIYQTFGVGEVLDLESVGVSIAVDDLYDGVKIEENPDESVDD